LWLLFCGLPHVNVVVVIVADAVLIVLVSLTRLLKLPWQSFSCGTALYLKKTKKKQAAIGGGMATENIRQICRQSRNLNEQITIVIGPDRKQK